MELHRYLNILRRRIALVLVFAVVMGGLGWFATSRTARYSAEDVIYIGARQFSVSPDARYAFDPTLLVERLKTTYSKMIDSEPIANDAIQLAGVNLSAGQVVARTTVIPVEETQLLTVRVTDPSPDVARRLADGVAQAFVEKVQTLDANTGTPAQEGTLPALPAYVFERAKLPVSPDPTGVGRNTLIGFVLGLLIGVGVVFLLEYLDLTIKSPAEAERRLQLPVLGVIPFHRDQAALKMLTVLRPSAESAPKMRGVI